MNLIAAVDENWAIGNKGELLVRIPNDQKTFRQMTIGKVVVLGRKTMDTFPGKRPLKDRTNIVLSTNPNYAIDGATVVHSLEEALEELKKYASEDVFIIGGASIYELFEPYCDTAHMTKLEIAYEADAYHPNLDASPDWEQTRESDEQTYFDLTYHFVEYRRKGKKA